MDIEQYDNPETGTLELILWMLSVALGWIALIYIIVGWFWTSVYRFWKRKELAREDRLREKFDEWREWIIVVEKKLREVGECGDGDGDVWWDEWGEMWAGQEECDEEEKINDSENQDIDGREEEKPKSTYPLSEEVKTYIWDLDDEEIKERRRSKRKALGTGNFHSTTYIQTGKGGVTINGNHIKTDGSGVLFVENSDRDEKTIKFIPKHTSEKCEKCGKSHGNQLLPPTAPFEKHVWDIGIQPGGWSDSGTELELFFLERCQHCGDMHEIPPPNPIIAEQFQHLDAVIQRIVKMHLRLPASEKLPAEKMKDASSDIERLILRAKFAEILHKAIFQQNVGEKIDYIEISPKTLKPIRDEVWAALRPFHKRSTRREFEDAKADVDYICRSAYKLFGLAFKWFDWDIEWLQAVSPSSIKPEEMEIVGSTGPKPDGVEEGKYVVSKVVFGGIVRSGAGSDEKKLLLKHKVIVDYPESSP